MVIVAATSSAFDGPPKEGIWSILHFRISSIVGIAAVRPIGRLVDAPSKKSSLFVTLLAIPRVDSPVDVAAGLGRFGIAVFALDAFIAAKVAVG